MTMVPKAEANVRVPQCQEELFRRRKHLSFLIVVSCTTELNVTRMM